MTIKELQKEVYANKLRRGFNVTSIGNEIIHLTEELGELARGYRDKSYASSGYAYTHQRGKGLKGGES